MASYYVKVSITYRQIGRPDTTETVELTSDCIPEPYSFELDREADAFFIIYNGGKQALERSWSAFELLDYFIISKEACQSVNAHDCINGICIKATEYNTPGFYDNLETCEKSCGTGCSGKCLSNKEWNQIKELARKLKSKNCK